MAMCWRARSRILRHAAALLPTQIGDLLMIEIEDVVEQEHGALRGREALEHDQEGHGDLVEALDAREPALVEIDGLGQPIGAALLAPRAGGVELVPGRGA